MQWYSCQLYFVLWAPPFLCYVFQKSALSILSDVYVNVENSQRHWDLEKCSVDNQEGGGSLPDILNLRSK